MGHDLYTTNRIQGDLECEMDAPQGFVPSQSLRYHPTDDWHNLLDRDPDVLRYVLVFSSDFPLILQRAEAKKFGISDMLKGVLDSALDCGLGHRHD